MERKMSITIVSTIGKVILSRGLICSLMSCFQKCKILIDKIVTNLCMDPVKRSMVRYDDDSDVTPIP